MDEIKKILDSIFNDMRRKWYRGLCRELREKEPELYERLKGVEEELNEALKSYKRGKIRGEEILKIVKKWRESLEAALLHKKNKS